MRATIAAALLSAVLATSGCYRYRPAVLPPAPGAQVRVVFRSPLDVTTLQLGPDTTRRIHLGIFEASGTIEAATADTVALLLAELHTRAGSLPSVVGQIALLPTSEIARIEERRFQPGTTLLVGAGAAALALTAYIIVLIATISSAW
jgi:hypothetical protein